MSACARPLRALAGALSLAALTGCSSSFVQRPYRFDVPAPPYAATQVVADRMRHHAEMMPVVVDPSRGVALSNWKIVGVSASLRLWPPGRDRYWLVERYRALVHPWGPVSVVSFDLERIRCNARGFRWVGLDVWGSCTPITEIAGTTQRAIDARGAALAAGR